MNKLFAFGAALVALTGISANSAEAANTRYICKLENTEIARGWIAKDIVIDLPGDGTVEVRDGIIWHYNGEKPLAGKILRESSSHLNIRWTLENMRSVNNTNFSKADYKATLTKATGAVRVEFKPRHFSRGLNAQGRCKQK